MNADTWTHVEMLAGTLVPLGSGIGWLIWRQAQNQLKLDMIWDWFINEGHEITGYKPGDENRLRRERP